MVFLKLSIIFLAFIVSYFVVVGAQQQKCGQTPIPPNLNSRIIGGTIATKYSWPWQIVWCWKQKHDCGYACTGTVVGTRWIMTAGHCVYGNTNNPQSWQVKTGVFDQRKTNESGEVVHEVKAIYLHPQYNPYPDPIYDVALVELMDEIIYADHTQPICLPSHDDTAAIEPNIGWETGWGLTEENGNGSKYLRQVNLPFVNYPTCENDYPGEITPKVHVCAGGVAGKGPCGGDSGGPLVVKNKNDAWFQYGLTSWGDGCAEYQKPGVFSRISAYCDFFQSTTNGAVTCQDPDSYA